MVNLLPRHHHADRAYFGHFLGNSTKIPFLGARSLPLFMADTSLALSCFILSCLRDMILRVAFWRSLTVLSSASEHNAYSMALIPSSSSNTADSMDAFSSTRWWRRMAQIELTSQCRFRIIRMSCRTQSGGGYIHLCLESCTHRDRHSRGLRRRSLECWCQP